MKRRTLIQGAAASLALPLSLQQARAQAAWPTGPVRIIVGFPPGGGTDALARVVGQKLSTMWGQQVLAENKAGAAGLLAAEFVAQQPADGSALLMSTIFSRMQLGQWQDRRASNALDGGVPWYDTYATSDGRFVAVGALPGVAAVAAGRRLRCRWLAVERAQRRCMTLLPLPPSSMASSSRPTAPCYGRKAATSTGTARS